MKLTCETCNKQYEFEDDMDKFPLEMKCNWCPVCEDTATDVYFEWYVDINKQITDDPNQIGLF